MTTEDIVLNNGFEDVVLFKDYSYDDALIGVTTDNVAVYDFELMVKWLHEKEGWSHEECVEWILYNTLGSYTTLGEKPIIMYPLEV